MAALAEMDKIKAQLAGYRRAAREALRLLAEHPELLAQYRARMDELDEQDAEEGDDGRR